jgi:hypothetical protein
MTTKISSYSIQTDFLNQIVTSIPKITAVSYTGDDTATSTAGGETVTITGTGFQSGAVVYVENTAAGTTTVVSSTQITFTAPAKAAGGYILYVINPDGGSGIYVPGVQYSGVPAWATTAGAQAGYYETQSINNTFVATSDSSVSYSLVSGAFPPGSGFNYSTGVLSGTAQAETGSTTYTFTLKATDQQNQDTNRTFSLTINTDVVTWSNPADGTTYNASQNSSISPITLSATSAAGSAVTYTANSLPAGITLTSGVISGSPTLTGNSATLLSATATTTGRSAVARTINWVVSLGNDPNWKYTSLLLSSNVTITGNSIINDASLNNTQITVAGDVRAQNFNPYSEGNYSVFFPATGSYLTGTTSFNPTSQTRAWTFECWIYPLTNNHFFAIGNGGAFGNGFYINWGTATANKFTFGQGNGSANPVSITSTGTYYAGQWYHVAVTNDTAGVRRLFVNGLLDGTQTYTAAALSSATTFVVNGVNDNVGLGNNGGSSYISNLRLVPDQTLYTANFIPATSSLTSISGTNLLLCKSYIRTLDLSPNNFTVTTAGNPAVNSANPFGNTAPTSVTVPATSNYSAYFDGTGDYYQIAANAAFSFPGDFTIEAWINMAIVSSGPYSIFGTGSGASNFDFRYFSNNFQVSQNAGSGTNLGGTMTAFTWTHVALVRSGSSIKCYVNGIATATTLTNSSTLGGSATTAYIGASDSTPSNNFNGYISNLRITKGQALYTANFAPSTSPLTTTSQGATAANVSLLTCQTSTVTDYSTNAFAITAVGNAVPSRNGPFVATATQSLTGTEGSLYFDGTSDYIYTATSPAFGFGTGDFTIEVWVYLTASGATNGYYITDFRSLSTTNVKPALYLTNTGQLYYYVYSLNRITGPILAPGNWYHIAVARSGGNTKLFVNGAQAGATYADTNDYGTTAIALLGNVGDAPGGYNASWLGYMSNYRVVKGTALYTSPFVPGYAPLTAVTNTQLLTLQNRTAHNNSAFVDSSTFGNITIRNGNVTSGTFSPYGNNWSMFCAGTGGAQVPASNSYVPGTSDFTMEFWVYITTATTNSFASSHSTGGMFVIGPASAVATPAVAFNFNATGGASSSYTTSTTVQTIAINTWNHIAVSRVSGTVYFYINGVRDTTVWSASGINIGSFGGAKPFYLGAGADASNYFPGYLSNFRHIVGTGIYSGATITVPTSPLTCLQNTVILTLQDNRLVDNSPTRATITAIGSGMTVEKFSPFSTITVPAYYSGSFNGSTDYLTVATSPTLDFGTGDFTVEAWVYTNSLAADWFIISATGSGGLFIGYATGFGFGWGRTAVAWDYRPGVITVSTWQHVAITRSGTSMRVFVNGVQAGTTQTLATAYNLGLTSTTIGSQGANYYLNGYISNLRVIKGIALYTGAFTVPTAPLSVTQSAGTNITALAGIPTGGNSVYFNGSSSISLPNTGQSVLNVAAGATFTIEAWVYLSSISSLSTILADNVPGAAFVYWAFDVSTSGNLRFYWYTGSTNFASTATVMAINTWYHVAMTANAGAISLFINGTSQTVTGTTTLTTPSGNTGSIAVGQQGSPVSYTTGYISNLRVVRGLALYTGSFTPSTSPLALTQAAGTNIVALTGIPTNGNSVFFNGTTDYLTATSPTLSASWTIEFWMYCTLASTQQTIVSFNGGSFSGINIWRNTSNQLVVDDGVNGQSAWTGVTMPTNAWAHVAIVKNGATTTGYINGAVTGSHTFTPSSTGFINVGRYNAAPYYYYNGYLSNMRVVNGTAVYTSAFTPATSPLTAISGTSFLSFQGNTITETSNNLTITRSGNPTISQTQSPFGYSPILLTCQPPYATVIADNSLASNPITINGTARASSTWSPFGYSPSLLALQNSTLTDSALDYLTITAATTTVKPLAVSPFTPTASSISNYNSLVFSGSMYFDGTGDYLTMPFNSPAILLGNNDFTIEAWIYPTTYSGANQIIISGQSDLASAAGSGFGIYISAATTSDFYVGATAVSVTSPNPVKNQWSHVAVVRNGQSLTMYLNGVRVGFNSFASATSAVNNGTTTYAPSIGAFSNAGTVPFAGYMSDVRIVKGAALYKANFFPGTAPATPAGTVPGTLTTYSSALLVNGTTGGVVDATRTVDLETVGDAKVTPFSPYNGSYYSNLFDGGTSYFTGTTAVAFPIGTETFTVEMWLNKSNAWNTGNQVLLISSTSSSFQLWVDASVPAIKVSFNGGATPLSYSTSSLALGTWYHLAVVRSSSSFTMYVNGVSVATGTDSGSFATPSSIIIGNFTSGTTSGWNGYVSNLRIVRGAAVYTSNFTPSTTSLTAVAGTSLLTCQSNKFVDNSTNALTLTPTGTPKVVTQNPFAVNAGFSYYFDGTGDYLKSAASVQALALGSGDFTLEYWIYPSSLAVQFTVIDFRGATSNVGFTDYVSTNGKINLFQEGGTTYLTTTGSLVAGAWTHVAYVRSSGTIKVYFNGVADATTASNTTNWLAPNGVGVIGVNYTLANYFTGYLADLRITRGLARYTATFTPPTSPAIAR